MTSQITIAERKRKRGLWPLFGALLAIALGIIAYFLAPGFIALIKQLLPRFQTGGMPQEQVRIIFALILFLVFLAIAATIVALFAPKKAINVKDSDLVKERKQIQQARKAERRRQHKLNIQFREQLKKK